MTSSGSIFSCWRSIYIGVGGSNTAPKLTTPNPTIIRAGGGRSWITLTAQFGPTRQPAIHPIPATPVPTQKHHGSHRGASLRPNPRTTPPYFLHRLHPRCSNAVPRFRLY